QLVEEVERKAEVVRQILTETAPLDVERLEDQVADRILRQARVRYGRGDRGDGRHLGDIPPPRSDGRPWDRAHAVRGIELSLLACTGRSGARSVARASSIRMKSPSHVPVAFRVPAGSSRACRALRNQPDFLPGARLSTTPTTRWSGSRKATSMGYFIPIM